jgi:hypothetical protein
MGFLDHDWRRPRTNPRLLRGVLASMQADLAVVKADPAEIRPTLPRSTLTGRRKRATRAAVRTDVDGIKAAIGSSPALHFLAAGAAANPIARWRPYRTSRTC